MNFNIIDFNRLERDALEFKEQWRTARPFELIVIDDFADPVILADIHRQFPDPITLNKSRDYFFAKEKYEKNDFSVISREMRLLRDELLSDRFRLFLQNVTGMSLFMDPEFHGGGLHSGGDGSYLDMHADFNVHPLHGDWIRELNILVYLNEGWEPTWGGHLKLRNAETGEVGAVEPLFNRCVVMLTKAHTLHGYDPISFPKGRYRRSIAAYAYSLAKVGDIQEPRSTLWVSDQSRVRRALGPAVLQLVRFKNKIFGSGSSRNR